MLRPLYPQGKSTAKYFTFYLLSLMYDTQIILYLINILVFLTEIQYHFIITNPYLLRNAHTHINTQDTISQVTGYELDDLGQIPGTVRNISRHHVQTGSGAHLVSAGGKGPLPLAVKWPEHQEYDHSPPSNAEVKNAWSYTSIPLYIFMVLCLNTGIDVSQVILESKRLVTSVVQRNSGSVES
jgi:hypothetical protein